MKSMLKTKPLGELLKKLEPEIVAEAAAQTGAMLAEMADMQGELEHRVCELETIIIDLVDGGLMTWREIQDQTGLSENRCKEMEANIRDIFIKHHKRDGRR